MYSSKPAENLAQKVSKTKSASSDAPFYVDVRSFLYCYVIRYRHRHVHTHGWLWENFWCAITRRSFWFKALLDAVDSETRSFRKHIGITWRIFLLFLIIKEKIEATSVRLYFWTRCACSPKDMPVIQGNQEGTLQRKFWTNKLYKQNSNQKI